MAKRLQLTLGGLFFALLFIYAGASAYRTLSLLSMRSDPGWLPYQVGNRVVIIEVNSSDAALPIRPYDEILEVNGQPIKYASRFADLFQDIEPGSDYTITINRRGQIREYTLQTKAVPLSAWMVRGAGGLIIANIFLITGIVVFLLKPFDKQALLLALMFGMFIGAFRAIAPEFAGLDWWLIMVMLTIQIASLFLWPVFFHFFQIFPEPSPVIRRLPRLEFYLYIPQLLTIFPYYTLLNLLAAFAPEKYPEFRLNSSLFELVCIGFGVLYIASGLLSLLLNYRQASRASRRKMRVVVAGSIAGFMPMFVFLGLAVLFQANAANSNFTRWLGLIAFFSFPLFPLSFAYAIIRHQVIPIRLILRRGVRYLLISRGFIIIQAIVVFMLLSFLLTGSRMAAIDRLGERADIMVTMLATAIAIGVLTIVNHRVMPIIDRKFFRESYDAQRVLANLGQEMRKVKTTEQLLKLAASKIQDALHTENVTIFLREQATGDYVCEITSHLTDDGKSTFDSGHGIVFPRDGSVVKRLSQTTQPFEVDFLYSQSLPRALPSIQPTPTETRSRELATLRRIRSALLSPIATQDQLLGIISLGSRLGDLPFSRLDRELLMTLAWQMAIAIQNAQLVREIAEEERLRHELEIATAVQQRLFPQHPPKMRRLDLSGVCHPARGVGGDYFDFIFIEEGKLGIAVADVAGKGISAALLMSTVQASLRSQAASVNGCLTALVSSMNRLLHLSTDASSYATFFYAQFDEDTGHLTYVNAGHNPPILIRGGSGIQAQGAGQALAAGADGVAVATEIGAQAGRQEIQLLTTGGLIIGAFPNSEYSQETIKLESGDLLVAYTDGVTEALNSQDNEFGEERLKRVIASSAHLPATEISQKIVEAIREWCHTTPQYDDLTLVIIKVK